ncbi:hypothetical protein J8C07_02325 [Chloracidobacterium sp. S]|uniref:hypothetical protein n=1 Tax=Chloracidobacterium aggregatum TaxID=2851959 RepID=UPI001B8C07AF|nr:hypothetical protein [Chloracidobacterium aggregatum]QUV88187.1 hypothetical protein J8C07_02325 [Chloracidobacterium sp. S]
MLKLTEVQLRRLAETLDTLHLRGVLGDISRRPATGRRSSGRSSNRPGSTRQRRTASTKPPG